MSGRKITTVFFLWSSVHKSLQKVHISTGNRESAEVFMKSLAIIVILFTAACSREAQPPVPGKPNNVNTQVTAPSLPAGTSRPSGTRHYDPGKLSFFPEELVGYTLTLMSKTVIAQYTFTDGGSVLANIGTVEDVRAGPMLQWEIDEQGRLVIDFNDYKEFWTKLSERGDLIDVEVSIGPIKPHRYSYTKTRPGGSTLEAEERPNASFTSEELIGSTLRNNTAPHPKYTFNPDGTGTFAADAHNSGQLAENQQTFKWSVDPQGRLQITRSSGDVMFLRKILQVSYMIVAESSRPSPPPERAIYRRTKQ